jgi:hypothetical protein
MCGQGHPNAQCDEVSATHERTEQPSKSFQINLLICWVSHACSRSRRSSRGGVVGSLLLTIASNRLDALAALLGKQLRVCLRDDVLKEALSIQIQK